VGREIRLELIWFVRICVRVAGVELLVYRRYAKPISVRYCSRTVFSWNNFLRRGLG
jgi:hypothetical protein